MATSEDTAPSRRLTFEWGRTAPAELAKIGDALDTKVLGVFATGSLIIGVAATRIQGILEWPNLALLCAFVAYLFILVPSVQMVFPQNSPGPDNPTKLREIYWHMTPEKAQVVYWNWVEKEYDYWYKRVNKKGRLFRYVIGGLCVEVLALITWLALITAF